MVSVISVQSVQLFSHVWLFATPWTTARQASMSITNSQSLFKLMSIKSVMPFNYLIPFPSCLQSLPVSESFPVSLFQSLCTRWPKYWHFSFSINPSNEYSGLISFRVDWFDLLAVQGTLKNLSNTTIQKHQFFSAQLSLWSHCHIHT